MLCFLFCFLYTVAFFSFIVVCLLVWYNLKLSPLMTKLHYFPCIHSSHSFFAGAPKILTMPFFQYVQANDFIKIQIWLYYSFNKIKESDIITKVCNTFYSPSSSQIAPKGIYKMRPPLFLSFNFDPVHCKNIIRKIGTPLWFIIKLDEVGSSYGNLLFLFNLSALHV